MVQLSHSYITTGKTIAWVRWTFVGKVMGTHHGYLGDYLFIYLFLYSSFVYSCHLFLIFSASVRSMLFLYFIVPIFA